MPPCLLSVDFTFSGEKFFMGAALDALKEEGRVPILLLSEVRTSCRQSDSDPEAPGWCTVDHVRSPKTSPK